MPTVRLKARYGTWYRSDDPNRVFYNFRTYLAIRASGPTMHSYVYFTNPFPSVQGVKVISAKLRLWMQDGTTNTGTRSISAQRVGQGLNFTRMTYNTRPTTMAGATRSVQTSGPLSGNHMFEIDVTADLAAVAAGATFYGYIVTTTAPFVIQLYGANASRYQPELVVNYSVPPQKPSSLSPSAGRAVGLAKPYLTFSYFDTTGSERLSALRVQTSPTSSFASPAWDSGTVTTTEAGLDLAETSFPGVPEDGDMWWRVQAQSADGSWSLWSEPASWKYRKLPVPTINTPGATFTDPTPPVSWTYSSPAGSAQARWRVSVHALVGGSWTLIDTSGERVGTDTLWTPTKPARNLSTPHRFTVEVHDGYNREATPGDSGWGIATKTISFSTTTGLAAPTNLQITKEYPRPGGTLTWSRNETPDFWLITRNGEQVARVPGPTLLVSGNQYRFVDRAPRGEHTWEVRAVVNNQTSGAASAVQDVEFRGAWLFGEGLEVCIQNDNEVDMAMAEVSAIHSPLGSTKVVIVTEALRGFEGSLSGLITELKGQEENPERWRADLLKIKSEPVIPYTLVVEDQVFPALIRNVQIRAVPMRHGWTAGFEFYQQDDLMFTPLED